MAQGRAAEAAEAIGKAELFFFLSFPTYHEVKMIVGHLQGDRSLLERSLAEVTRAGCVPLEMYGRLYLGIADLRHGRGRARLAALSRDAHDLGYGLFVRWAEQAVTGAR